MSQSKPSVTRDSVLSVHLREKQSLSRVEIARITIPKGGKADYHSHPCPVVGTVVSGNLLFQIEGEEPQHLKAGEGFYEPRNQPILHFDNESETEDLVFMAYYLLEDNEGMITILPKDKN